MTSGTHSRVSRFWVLALTSLGFFMSMMDSMIVTTASTSIREDFHVTVGQLQWTLNAYNVSVAAFLLPGVALGNRIGHRRMYETGLLLFVLGSVSCALAPNLVLLVVSRICQGIGAAVMTPMSMAILSTAFPASERGKALGIWSGVGGLALIVGPALGGAIVSYFSWPWIFWINVPVGLLAVVLSQSKLSESVLNVPWPSILDSLLVIGAAGGLVWSLSEFSTRQSGMAVVGGVASCLAAVGFVLRQNNSSSPMVPLSLFKSPTFTGGAVATFLLYAAMYGVVFFFPQYLQVTTGVDALTAGLEILPWTATLVIVSPFSGRAVDKFGERPIAVIGLAMQLVGYLWIAIAISHPGPYWRLLLPLFCSGAGISMAGPALQKAVLGAVDASRMGVASGVFNTFRQLGGAVGTAVAVMAFYLVGSSASPSSFSAGTSAALVGSTLLTFLGVAFALIMRSSATRE
ncbi:MFS transporter [Actinomyces oris]|jgi:drug resistance MFS transporter, drug:H+ antiporter-2 family|uniref:DHA2 family efflux MFS transporter permease subunit n=1 Tax=Actinomyces oris TaxID=544580 RepID=UPI00094D78ED|nr:DHA2 family efflux MFS transporter permease subunit [Actinomyces oris]OLO64280.1 MFS transporter [Actinomyces oris]